MNDSRRTYALVSGVAILIMAIAAGYAYGYVQNSLVIADDPGATMSNLKDNPNMFGSGIISWLIILSTDLLVAWSLYKFFAYVNTNIAVATGVLRAVYSVILAAAIYHLVAIWQMLQASTQDEMAIMDLLNTFEKYWSLGLILFGVHLIGLGYLTLKSISVPKWLGWLLYIAGLSYSLINGVKAIAPDAADTVAVAEMIMGAPMAIAEIGLAVWLIWKGGKQESI